MEAERLAKLSDGQRACLRLVYQHKTSKDIARELGISPHTVDQRLKVAIQTLGVSGRVEAALLLAQYEGHQSLVHQSPDVAPARSSGTITPVDHGKWQQGQDSGRRLREEQVPYVPTPPPPFRLRLPLPEMRGGRNELSPWARIGWIVAIAVVAVFAFGIFLAGLEALGKLGLSATQRQS